MHRLDLWRLRPDQAQKLPQDSFHPVHLAANTPNERGRLTADTPGRFRSGEGVLEVEQAEADRVEAVADFMRQAGGERAERAPWYASRRWLCCSPPEHEMVWCWRGLLPVTRG